MSGREFELVGFAHTWGEHRVFFQEPGQTRVRSLPATWTDVGGPDPFLALSAGRACFRPEDLLRLALLLTELQARPCKRDYAAHVKVNMPAAKRRSAKSGDQLHIQDENG
jgi:hypothetical protein